MTVTVKPEHTEIEIMQSYFTSPPHCAHAYIKYVFLIIDYFYYQTHSTFIYEYICLYMPMKEKERGFNVGHFHLYRLTAQVDDKIQDFNKRDSFI